MLVASKKAGTVPTHPDGFYVPGSRRTIKWDDPRLIDEHELGVGILIVSPTWKGMTGTVINNAMVWGLISGVELRNMRESYNLCPTLEILPADIITVIMFGGACLPKVSEKNSVEIDFLSNFGESFTGHSLHVYPDIDKLKNLFEPFRGACKETSIPLNLAT